MVCKVMTCPKDHGFSKAHLPQKPWFPKNLDPFHWGNMGPFPLRNVSCFRKNLGPSSNIAFHDHEISTVKSIELKTYHFKSKCLATMSHHFAYIRLMPLSYLIQSPYLWDQKRTEILFLAQHPCYHSALPIMRSAQ